MRNLTGSPPYGGVNGNRVVSYNCLKNPGERKKQVIDTENTMQAWNLMDFEDSLKIHTSFGNQE